MQAINARLPRDIAVTAAWQTTSSFHPRYDAISRVYRYLVWNRPVRSPFWESRAAHVRPRIDVEAMDGAAARLVGRHDFSAFAPARHKVGSTRTMFRAACRRDGDLVILEFEAQGFRRQMVRALAGTLLEVGLGKIDAGAFVEILRSGDRARAATTMPACGLYLVEVKYPGEVQSLNEQGEVKTPDSHGVRADG
jgi:tRNA pseudouridine38-40 synthase